MIRQVPYSLEAKVGSGPVEWEPALWTVECSRWRRPEVCNFCFFGGGAGACGVETSGLEKWL